MPNAASRSATSTPIRPRPTIPTVLSSSSTPEYLLRFQAPALSAWLAGAMFRAVASSSPTASSAAEVMLEVGALTTMTPATVAALTSTLSRPPPRRATSFSRRGPGLRPPGCRGGLLLELRGRARQGGIHVGEGREQLVAVGTVTVPDLEV